MKVVTFGEIMLRLTPQNNLRYSQANSFEASYGGGEANVAVSLAHFNHDVSFVTKLPNNPIAHGAIRSLKIENVNVDEIVIGGDRIGIYFLEKGASQRSSQVIYDRNGSSISLCEEDDFDFNKIFKDIDWFHFTGITPALGDNVTNVLMKALKIAKEKNIKVSCDLNYRKKLWTKEKAQITMSKLMKYVDVLIANEEDAENVFGIKAENTEVQTGKLSRESYENVAKKLSEIFDINTIAITLRTSLSADDNLWSGMIYTNNKAEYANEYRLHIVDRVGGGDSFAAGLIHALMLNYDAKRAVEFATAASALKHSIVGDYNRVSIQEVETLMKGDGSGRVQR